MHSSVIFTFRCNLLYNKVQRNQIKITKQWITHYFEYISIYLPTASLIGKQCNVLFNMNVSHNQLSKGIKFKTNFFFRRSWRWSFSLPKNFSLARTGFIPITASNFLPHLFLRMSWRSFCLIPNAQTIPQEIILQMQNTLCWILKA